jgi:rubredoxin
MMKRYKCRVCGYIYDPEKGEPRRDTPPGTPFEELKSNWRCPKCNAPLHKFVALSN